MCSFYTHCYLSLSKILNGAGNSSLKAVDQLPQIINANVI